MNAAKFVSRLGPAGRPRQSGNSWMACCPAHIDKSPSLSVADGKKGVVLQCFAGCSAEAICAAVGLRMGQLFNSNSRLTRAQPRAANELKPEQKRESWPTFERPSSADLQSISELRNIGINGLQLAVDRGLLRCADHRGTRCYIITDDTRCNAQARRLDGNKFDTQGGKKKALTLPGSSARWPLGCQATQRNILLCEGGPDLLAAHHFIEIESRESDFAAVGILGASNHLAESVLPYFAGKRVRILPHVDEEGAKAARRWSRALLPVAATVDIFDLSNLRRVGGEPVGDLNDACWIHPDDFESTRELWSVCPE